MKAFFPNRTWCDNLLPSACFRQSVECDRSKRAFSLVSEHNITSLPLKVTELMLAGPFTYDFMYFLVFS